MQRQGFAQLTPHGVGAAGVPYSKLLRFALSSSLFLALALSQWYVTDADSNPTAWTPTLQLSNPTASPTVWTPTLQLGLQPYSQPILQPTPQPGLQPYSLDSQPQPLAWLA